MIGKADWFKVKSIIWQTCHQLCQPCPNFSRSKFVMITLLSQNKEKVTLDEQREDNLD